jgi:diguanylate cyclase (GGDEF)-like protein
LQGWRAGRSEVQRVASPLEDTLLKAGYAVVNTDYEGLGTPGIHPYLVGVSAGRSVLDIVRAVNKTRDPTRLAELLVERAPTWVPAPCWAVVSSDLSGRLTVLAERGLTQDMGPAVGVVAEWVMQNGEEFATTDLRADTRVSHPSVGAVLAFPLVSRGAPVGALIAIDRQPCSREPKLAPGPLRAVRILLEPAAAALDNAMLLKRAEALSVTDDLTRLYNSRYLNQVLRRETKRASRSGHPLSLLFVDLDGFKAINDRHGHLFGSRALVEVADVVRRSARETDVVARFGGDEFALVLPETGREGAFAVGERVRQRIAAHRFLAADGLDIRLTASVGVATLPDVAVTPDELVQAADMAMYRVKQSGKNGIQAATSPADN